MWTYELAAVVVIAAEPRGSVSIPWWVYPIALVAIVIVSSLGPLSRMAERREARRQEQERAKDNDDTNDQPGGPE